MPPPHPASYYTDGVPIWYADQARAAARGLRGRNNQLVTPPRMHTADEEQYDTRNYILYDYTNPNPGPLILQPWVCNGSFDQRPLSSGSNIQTAALLPAQQGVRLDDFHCFVAARDTNPKTLLHLLFGSEFDRNGDIRASRVPLGHAAKVWRMLETWTWMEKLFARASKDGIICGGEGSISSVEMKAGRQVCTVYEPLGMTEHYRVSIHALVIAYPSVRQLTEIANRWLLLEEILQSRAATTILTPRTRFVLRSLRFVLHLKPY